MPASPVPELGGIVPPDEPLTEQQLMYVHFRAQGFQPKVAAEKAGYKGVGYKATTKNYLSVENNPNVQRALKRAFEDCRQRYNLDRDHIIEGMMEALAVAREQSDANTMLKVWTELARVTGLNAPEVREIKITGPITPATLTSASDHELLKLLGKTRDLTVVDGQYEEIAVEDADGLARP